MSFQPRDLSAEVGDHVASFVADRSDDVQRLSELDALRAAHTSIYEIDRVYDDADDPPFDDSGKILRVLIEMCRDRQMGRLRQRGDHSGVHVFVPDVLGYLDQMYDDHGFEVYGDEGGATEGAARLAAAVRSCAEALAVLGFKVLVYHGQCIPGIPEHYNPMSIEFPQRLNHEHCHFPMIPPTNLPPGAGCTVHAANPKAPWALIL